MRLHICDHIYLNVVVHESQETMPESGLAGVWLGHAVENGLFGTLHLYAPKVSSGLFAHELQHVLIDWACFTSMEPLYYEEDAEEMACLAQSLTDQFMEYIESEFEWDEDRYV